MSTKMKKLAGILISASALVAVILGDWEWINTWPVKVGLVAIGIVAGILIGAKHSDAVDKAKERAHGWRSWWPFFWFR